MSEEEKIFREKLKAFGIEKPIIRKKNGILYATPSPLSSRKWKATYNHDKKKRFSFEEL